MIFAASSIVFRSFSNALFAKHFPYESFRSFGTLRSFGTSKSKEKFTPPVSCNDELELYIEDLSNLGLGVGRKNYNGHNWVIMVPLVLPGESVKVRIKRNLGTYSEAELVKVIIASDDRVVPPCKYFSVCGGCQYQHMNITAQRNWKRSQVSTALQRIAKIEDACVQDTIGTDHVYSYRAKLTPHYKNDSSNCHVITGFQLRSTNEIIDVDHCMVASDAINEEYENLRSKLRAGANINSTNAGQLLFRESVGRVTSDPQKIVSETVNGIEFQFKAGEFFQNNPFVLPLVIQHVISQAAGDECDFLIDAYCGSGLFALSAASRFKKVLGIEVSQKSVEAAISNARLNNIYNVEFTRGEAQHIFKRAKILPLPPENTVVVLDPPRRGCDPAFLRQLISFAPRKVVYVSCEPTTQARDTQHILQAGYRILDVTPFDMFPQTRHVESIITFVKQKLTY